MFRPDRERELHGGLRVSQPGTFRMGARVEKTYSASRDCGSPVPEMITSHSVLSRDSMIAARSSQMQQLEVGCMNVSEREDELQRRKEALHFGEISASRQWPLGRQNFILSFHLPSSFEHRAHRARWNLHAAADRYRPLHCWPFSRARQNDTTTSLYLLLLTLGLRLRVVCDVTSAHTYH